jgi:hypothetical protein
VADRHPPADIGLVAIRLATFDPAVLAGLARLATGVRSADGMAGRPDSTLDPEGLYDRDRMQAMTRPVFTARVHGIPPPGWPKFPAKLGELASLDILGPFEDGLGGSYHVAFFLDTHSTHAWVTPLVAISVLELEGAVRRYQAVVVDHLKEFPATTCPMHLLDVSCILPAGMPTTVTSALLGPHGQHLVIKTRLRADRSHGHLLNPVEQVARSILYRTVLYIRRASMRLFFCSQ